MPKKKARKMRIFSIGRHKLSLKETLKSYFGNRSSFSKFSAVDGNTLMSLRLKLLPSAESEASETALSDNSAKRLLRIDLGNGSEVIYIPRLIPMKESWGFFDYLNTHIPWTRPTIRVFGRSCLQPRDTCYVASSGLQDLAYSGYQPHAYSWDEFPPLKEILDAVQKMLPGSRFNSLLLNRYKGGNDYVGWHADDEKLYGPTPEIASVSFGSERDFFLKKKPSKSSRALNKGSAEEDEPVAKKARRSSHGRDDQHSWTLKHGSLLVMKGYTQRDWIHSVPKRAKVDGTRINLTFRHVLS